jgi:hypothetical protein
MGIKTLSTTGSCDSSTIDSPPARATRLPAALRPAILRKFLRLRGILGSVLHGKRIGYWVKTIKSPPIITALHRIAWIGKMADRLGEAICSLIQLIDIVQAIHHLRIQVVRILLPKASTTSDAALLKRRMVLKHA